MGHKAGTPQSPQTKLQFLGFSFVNFICINRLSILTAIPLIWVGQMFKISLPLSLCYGSQRFGRMFFSNSAGQSTPWRESPLSLNEEGLAKLSLLF